MPAAVAAACDSPTSPAAAAAVSLLSAGQRAPAGAMPAPAPAAAPAAAVACPAENCRAVRILQGRPARAPAASDRQAAPSAAEWAAPAPAALAAAAADVQLLPPPCLAPAGAAATASNPRHHFWPGLQLLRWQPPSAQLPAPVPQQPHCCCGAAPQCHWCGHWRALPAQRGPYLVLLAATAQSARGFAVPSWPLLQMPPPLPRGGHPALQCPPTAGAPVLPAG